MYLSRPLPVRGEEKCYCELGRVTGSGEGRVSALAETEERELRIFAPGGYSYLPERDDTVLMPRAGLGGELAVIAGVEAEQSELKPGEVRIAAGGCCVHFTRDGKLFITGEVYINGVRA